MPSQEEGTWKLPAYSFSLLLTFYTTLSNEEENNKSFGNFACLFYKLSSILYYSNIRAESLIIHICPNESAKLLEAGFYGSWILKISDIYHNIIKINDKKILFSDTNGSNPERGTDEMEL